MIVEDFDNLTAEEIIEKASKREEVDELLKNHEFNYLDEDYALQCFEQGKYAETVVYAYEDIMMTAIAEEFFKPEMCDKYFKVSSALKEE